MVSSNDPCYDDRECANCHNILINNPHEDEWDYIGFCNATCCLEFYIPKTATGTIKKDMLRAIKEIKEIYLEVTKDE